jgi:RNA polymerase sigma-70 factor (ECF subfamily)
MSGAPDAAFEELVARHRRELHAHCYRMLGSVPDAEDALQDALLRAWRALPRFEGRSSVRAWLYRIATNACIDAANRRPKRVLPIDYGPASDAHDGPGPPLTETAWIDPYPDTALTYEQREGVELAFIAAVQHLPARQRAVLILREVLGFSSAEVADSLETTTASVNSALQRARAAVEEKLPEQSQQATLDALGDPRVKQIVAGYTDAWERGDVDAVAAMLAEEVTITMPPMATWFQGEGVLTFLREWAFSGRACDMEGRRNVRVLPTSANGQPAFGTYSFSDERSVHLPTVLQVLTFRGERITEITGFVTPGVFGRFGLPGELS